MMRSVEHFIFVPGIGAGASHPVGRQITESLRQKTRGALSIHFAKTCDEIGNIIVPHSIDRQAEALTDQIRSLRGEVAVLAHSQGGLVTAMAAADTSLPQLNPANVILAGAPLRSDLSLQRTILRASCDTSLVTAVRSAIPMLDTIG